MAATQPTSHLRRSMIYRILAESGAEFEVVNDAAMAVRFNTNTDESTTAKHMGLADLSPLARTGFKGKDAPKWLGEQGVEIPAAPNQARLQSDGALIARLSNDEHLVLCDLRSDATLISNLNNTWALTPDFMCFQMPRAETHCWMVVTGIYTSEMLAKVCGVDLRLDRFANHRVAQTSVARTNGVVIRNDFGSTPAFYILADSASADFMWPCLMDAMEEFDGAPVGLDALVSLCSQF